MSNKITYFLAAILLITLFVTCILSVKDDALTFDEKAHLPAGYSYLVKQDYRLNPEHPPLAKDLSAIPLLFQDINFPEESSSWKEGSKGTWWVQFNFGDELLYQSGNNADQMIFWGKIPMIFLLMILGLFLFKWTRELRGNKTALLVLTLFSFSPTFIAHGRLVTTDVAAALGIVISTYYYLKFLKNSTKKNILLAGIAIGISMLFKFSLILLLPFFAIITLLFAWLKSRKEEKPLIKNIFKYVFLAVMVAIIAVVFVIWPVYHVNMIKYPPELQQQEARAWLETTTVPDPLINLNLWMTENPVTRPISQYLLGLLMATNRTATGNTTYFLGMVSAAGWWYYFPVVYFLKVPLAFHILLLFSVLTTALFIRKDFYKKMKDIIWRNFTEFSMIIFILIYLGTSITGSLNIGIRHLLPIFPFLYILTSIKVRDSIGKIRKPLLRKGVIAFVIILLIWYVSTSLMIFPHYLTFFNWSVGGAENGYKYVVDSNLDWGQDFKRLEKWIEEEKIDKIYLDYFGGANPEYYLGEKYVRWDGKNPPEEFPRGNYIAISASQIQGGRGIAAPDYDQPTDFYMWLNDEKLVKTIGNSIFVYYVE
jgi:hypothetical protein